MSRILVTGGLGFIGHAVVSKLEELGHSVLIADTRTTYGIIPQAELDYLIAQRLKKIKTNLIFDVDITHRYMHHLIQSHAPEVVVHLASFPRQKVVNSNPQFGSRVMSEGLLNLLEASVRGGVQRFVYVSSSMVYGNFDNGVHEDAPCHPIGQYGVMKLAGEWLVRDYSGRTTMTHTIIRPSAVYGPNDVADRVVAKFMTSAMRGGILDVNGPDEVLDFTYVDDLASGIALASLNTLPNHTFNLTRGVGRTLQEAAELVIKIVGKGTINLASRNLAFPRRGSLDISSARSAFQYDPRVDIEQGFQLYYNWLSA
jgi:nucleoside-diphosphate-sugar epimerase